MMLRKVQDLGKIQYLRDFTSLLIINCVLSCAFLVVTTCTVAIYQYNYYIVAGQIHKRVLQLAPACLYLMIKLLGMIAGTTQGRNKLYLIYPKTQ